MAKPIPLIGVIEGHVIDYRRMRRRALANDGEIDHDEALALVAIADDLVKTEVVQIPTVRHALVCLTGGRGMDSQGAEQSWQERQRSRSWGDEDPTPPAMSAKAA